MGSEHHPEILSLIRGRIWHPRETHFSAHFAERVPFIFLQPRFDGNLAVIVGWAGAETASVKASRH